MNKILYTTHVMWWHSKLMPEILESVENALKKIPENLQVDFLFTLNAQTYMEEPETGTPMEMFDEFINHPVVKNSKINYKTNKDNFYNACDFARETYGTEYDYTIWGHPDCLVPENYFIVLNEVINSNLPTPHVLTPSRQKMWDDSWKHVEHFHVRDKSIEELLADDFGKKMVYRYQITLPELNEVNNRFEDKISVHQVYPPKSDAALITISKNMPVPFIHPNLRLKRDDTFLMLFIELNNIPQYLIEGMIPGHLLHHPKKQTNVKQKNNAKILHDLLEKKFQLILEVTRLESLINTHLNRNK